MHFVEDPEAARWLEALEGKASDFDWNAGNQTKNRKHGVQAEDIESIFEKPIVFAGRIVEPEHAERRWLLLGQDANRRFLALVFTRRGNLLRPISCRAMRRGERKFYETHIEES